MTAHQRAQRCLLASRDPADQSFVRGEGRIWGSNGAHASGPGGARRDLRVDATADHLKPACSIENMRRDHHGRALFKVSCRAPRARFESETLLSITSSPVELAVRRVRIWRGAATQIFRPGAIVLRPQ